MAPIAINGTTHESDQILAKSRKLDVRIHSSARFAMQLLTECAVAGSLVVHQPGVYRWQMGVETQNVRSLWDVIKSNAGSNSNICACRAIYSHCARKSGRLYR